MKERILRVLMFFAISFGIGMTVFVAVFYTGEILESVAFGIIVIAIASALQYILIAEWHPMYLFKNNRK